MKSSRFFEFKNNNKSFLLNHLFEKIKLLVPNLIQELKPNTLFYRSRKNFPINLKTKEEYMKELGPPPYKNSQNNRMSPDGISYFYLSENIETSLSEIGITILNNIFIGEFRLLKSIKIIDLSILNDFSFEKKYTNIFSVDYIHKTEDIINFFKEFSKEISKPVDNKDNSREYIPTQVLTEFIRSKGFKGIKYKSSKNPKGNNYVLFFGPEDNEYLEKYNEFFDLNNVFQYKVLSEVRIVQFDNI